MFTIQVDNVEFLLKKKCDFTWLQKLGKVFTVFDQNDSGNISFGVYNGKEKFFVKVAGLSTSNASQSQEDTICALKTAIPIYENIKHPNLIQLVKHYSVNDLYIAIFKWAEGDCLFDHWNFEKYAKNSTLIPPAKRFKQLSLSQKIISADVLFSFLETVSDSGYVAVDFYDGSIMYDFQNDTITICDIDLFRQKPAWNDMGEDYWGTKRLKAPEEYQYGAVIDEITNVYTLGALLFDSFFGNYSNSEIQKRYQKHIFEPCSIENWELNRTCYEIAKKAVSKERKNRYSSIQEFHKDWKEALKTL